MSTPTFIIVAGPNGAGKTTFVQKVFPELIQYNQFLNADIFADQFILQNQENIDIKAARKLLTLRGNLIEKKKNIIIESTLATLTLKNLIEALKGKYKVSLYFLWISTPLLCDFRVKERVAKGGHNIPIDKIFRRYFKGLSYLNNYLDLVDEAYIYLADDMPHLISVKDREGFCIKNKELWEKLQLDILELGQRTFLKNKA